MTRKPAAGLNALIKRALAPRVAPPTPEPVADPAGLEGLRVIAETRAAAAEIIAQEATAIRFKALLDAAREQAANRDIRSAEERFAAAKDEWETVQQGLQPEPDPYAAPAGTASPSSAQPASGTFPALPHEMDESAWRNWLLLGGLPMVALVAAIGISIHLYPGSDAATIAAEQAVRPAAQALDTPPRLEPTDSTAVVEELSPKTISTAGAKTAPRVKTAARVHSAEAAKKAKQQVTAPPPRIDPVPEELAEGERARVESIWTDRAVE